MRTTRKKQTALVAQKNREWLERQGIVADEAGRLPSKNIPLLSELKTSKPFWIWRNSFLLILFSAACFFVFAWVHEYRKLDSEVQQRQMDFKNMGGANTHLRETVKRLALAHAEQQTEVNRISRQMQEMAQYFHERIRFAQKREAVSDALCAALEMEWNRLSHELKGDQKLSQVKERMSSELLPALELPLEFVSGTYTIKDT